MKKRMWLLWYLIPLVLLILIFVFIPLVTLAKVGVFVLTVSFLIFRVFSNAKDEYDDRNEVMDKEVWFDHAWDNLLVWFLGSALCAALSSELAVPFIMKFIPEFSDYAEGTLTYSGIAICTVIGWKLGAYLKK